MNGRMVDKLDYLKERCRNLTPEDKARVGDILIGILSVYVPEQKWIGSVDTAVRMVTGGTSPGRP